MNFIKLTALLTGTVMAGEALALPVGMHVLSDKDNLWVPPKNDVLLVFAWGRRPALITGTVPACPAIWAAPLPTDPAD